MANLITNLTTGDRVEVHGSRGEIAVGTVTRIISREGARGGVVEVKRDRGLKGFELGDTLSLHPTDCERC